MNLKSAWEISREKAAAMDGRSDKELSLTDGQRERIAETRKVYGARIAERELDFNEKLRVADSNTAGTMKEELNNEKRRLNDERDEKIEKIRKGGDL